MFPALLEGFTRLLHAHCPLKANNVHADTHCSVTRNHPVCGEQNFFALGPVPPIMTFSYSVPRKLKALYLAKVLLVPSQAPKV